METPRWLIITGRILFVLVAGTLMSGIVYEQAARYIARSNFPPPGEFLEVDRQRFHYLKKGEGSQSVIFASGNTLNHTEWTDIQAEIAKSATTLSYDRAGLLYSDRGKRPQTAAAISEELKKIIEKADLPKPYILVAHSLSACSLRPLIKDLEKDIAGVIFVDGSHPEQYTKVPEQIADVLKNDAPSGEWEQFLNGFGFLRTMMRDHVHFEHLAVHHPRNEAYRANYFHSMPEIYEEMEAVDQILAETKNITSFGSIPLTVITGSSEKRIHEFSTPEKGRLAYDYWMALQKDLLSLSSNSQQIMATKSSHMIHHEEPRVIIKAIQEMLQLASPQK